MPERQDALHRSGDAADSLAVVVARAVGLKPFPIVATQVMRILANSTFERRELVSCIRQDPALASRVLRLANSAFFAAPHCRTIELAVAMLGAENVQALVAAAATMELFADSDGVGLEVRDHSASVAALAERIGGICKPARAPGLFLAGLMHDVGKLMAQQVADFDYSTIDPFFLNNAAVVHVLETKVWGYNHAVLGAMVLSEWNIPEPTPILVASHHADPVSLPPEQRWMVQAIELADRIDYELHNASRPVAEFVEERSDLLEAVGFTAAEFWEIWPQFEEASRLARAFFLS